MKSIEIESWALRVLERIERHLPTEDSRVELKSNWPDPTKAARRLAGHANASRGETILWLIGADEKQGLVSGVNGQDLANWFPQVKACFESEVPGLQDLNVTYKGTTVAALCFDTSRFPFVVKNSKGGEIQFEVPWRDGTAIRSACRSDLVIMLSPLVKLPKSELLHGDLTLDIGKNAGGLPSFTFRLMIYIVPRETGSICFPIHKCTAEVLSGNQIVADSFTIKMDAPRAKERRFTREGVLMGQRVSRSSSTNIEITTATDTIDVTEDELTMRGPGKILLDGLFGPAIRYGGEDDLEVRVKLIEAISELPIVISGSFSREKDSESVKDPTRWILNK
jgi:hypothetical protein